MLILILEHNRMDDTFTRCVFTKTVACICAVTIHMTGRHYGLFLLN